MADIAIFRINYKSDFILTLQSDAGWTTPFCIKFWTGAPSQAYYAYYDGMSYTHCTPMEGEPTKLLVQFDDHHLPIGDLKFQIGYHFTVADFPTSIEDEVINQAAVIINNDGEQQQVMLDFNGETAPEIEFALPAYVNEAQRIANEQARIAAEEQRIINEEARIAAEQERQQNEQQRINQEQQRISQEQQRVNAEAERVSEFASLKTESEASTDAANIAATLANEKAQLADDKAALAQAAATLANEKAQLAEDKANLAQQKADYAQMQGNYAKTQGDAAKTEAEAAHSLNEEVSHDEATRQQQEAARQQAEAQRVIDFNAQMQQQQTAYTNAEAARDTAFDEAETERDAKVDAKVADITNLQAQLGYFVCDTDAAVAAKTIAATGYALTTGGNIRIKMTNANTVNEATLNINSTGAKPLFYEGARASSTNTWAADDVLEIYYDGTNYQAKNVSPTFKTGERVNNVGVDDEPTAGSDNLVKSGGVNAAINNRTLFGEKQIPIPTLKWDYFITANGNHGREKYSYHKEILVEGGMVYKIISNLQYDSLCAFTIEPDTTPSSGSSIPLTSDNQIYTLSKGETYYIQAPSDAKYLVFNAWYSTSYSGGGYSIEPLSIFMMLDASYLNKKILLDETPYEIIDTEINTSSFSARSYPFTSTGEYRGPSSIAHYDHSVVPNNDYIITAGEESINIGWLKSNSAPVPNGKADLSLYDGKVYVISSQTITLTAPVDAVSIVVSALPLSVIMRHAKTYNEQVIINKEDIDDLREDVDMLTVPLMNQVIPSTSYSYCIRDVNGRLFGNSSYQRTCVPVIVGKKYRIIASDLHYNFVGWLTNPAPNAINNAIIPTLVPNTVCTQVPAGQYVDLIAPEGAVYLSINIRDMVDGAITDITPVVGMVISLEEYLVTEKYPETIFDFNPDWEIRNKLLQAKRKLNLNGSGTSGVVPLLMLHLSDIHGDKKSWDRMIEFKTRYREYIDDAICTGDIVDNTIVNDKTFLENGCDGVMLSLGNHDCAKSGWNKHDTTSQECYEALFEPYIENWGVTYEVNKCYYYKDYTEQKIRLIVLDTTIGYNESNEHWNSTQMSWFEARLSEARTNGYHVIVAQHYWAVKSSGRTYVDCTFTCKNPLGEGEAIIPSEAMDAVQAFINDGGIFICWISGHTHRDFVYYPTAYPKQLGLVVDCASGYSSAKNVCDEDRQAGTKSIDAFNIYAFDTTRKIIKVIRIGSDTDSLMRHKGTLTLKYGGDVPEVIYND